MAAAKGSKSTKERGTSAKKPAATRSRSTRSKSGKKVAPQPKDSNSREIGGLVAIALALVLFLSLGSHNPEDGSNWIGLVGRWSAETLYFFAGIGAWAIAGFVLFLALRLLLPDRIRMRLGVTIGALVTVLSFITLLQVLVPSSFQPWGAPIGGFVGDSIASLTIGVIGKVGAVILLFVAFVCGMAVITRASIVALTTKMVEGVRITTSKLSIGARLTGLFVAIFAATRSAFGAIGELFKRKPKAELEDDEDDEWEDEEWEEEDEDDPIGVETTSSVLRRPGVAVVPAAAQAPPASRSNADAFDPAPIPVQKASEFDPAPSHTSSVRASKENPQILEDKVAFDEPVHSTIPLKTADVLEAVEEPVAPPPPPDPAQSALENARKVLEERKKARGASAPYAVDSGDTGFNTNRLSSNTQERVREKMYNPIANPMDSTTRANAPVELPPVAPVELAKPVVAPAKVYEAPTPVDVSAQKIAADSVKSAAGIVSPAELAASLASKTGAFASTAETSGPAKRAEGFDPPTTVSKPVVISSNDDFDPKPSADITPTAPVGVSDRFANVSWGDSSSPEAPSLAMPAVSADIEGVETESAAIRPVVSRRITIDADDDRLRTRVTETVGDDDDDDSDEAPINYPSRESQQDDDGVESLTAPHRIEWPKNAPVQSVVNHGNERETRPLDPVDIDEEGFDLPEDFDASTPTGPQIIESEAQKNRPTSESFATALKALEEQRARQPWRFPPIDFFRYEEPDVEVDEDKLRDVAFQLVEALSDYKVRGKVTGICPGPVVTRFEFEPEPGTKLSKISGLATDIAMRLRAENVRIIAPIPGKGCVGVEIPNDFRETVYLKEILADRRFTSAKSKLTMALGKDIEGFPIVADLAKMPHLLVAGTTGSGKSVSVNAMITSVLCNASPDDVRLILIDPKQLEFALYEDIPHLLLPVVTDPMKAATALQWAVQEMERRYRLMKDLRVRNIEGYNEKLQELQEEVRNAAFGRGTASSFAKTVLAEEEEDGRPRHRHMPFIIVVVDEFADLMMAAGKDVEIAVARIAQKARAAGIHCILATQRPSVDVLTGTIKSNFPTRMSFRLMTGTDSRTVIDTQGAEALLGMGDMLYRPPGSSDLVRVHGAFVDEREIEKVVEFLKEQREADYDESILSGDVSSSDDDADERLDPKYEEALDVCIDAGFASISMIQRRLGIGYNRAANIVEEMERRGVVGPSSGGASRREVLIRR